MTEAQLLDKDAFNRLVLERELKTWEVGGYEYTGFHGPDGYELYRTYGSKWRMLYQARRIATNTNAAGGAIIVDVIVPTGMMAELVEAYSLHTTTGAHGGNLTVYDEDNQVCAYLSTAASAATGVMQVPNIGTAGTSSGNLANSQKLLIGPGQKLGFSATGASGVANDTLAIYVKFLLPIEATTASITWTAARSTNAAQTTIAASTISDANTLQAVLVP